MNLLLIYNASDRRCGFRNFGDQTLIALRRAGHTVDLYDGTYSAVVERHQQGDGSGFLPLDAGKYDLVHVIWHAMTLNHYAGADWGTLKTSWWDGGPSDATCPFKDRMQIRWSDYPRDGYEYLWYPVPDWIEDRPAPAERFTVGVSTVRGDGLEAIEKVCTKHGWALNRRPVDVWLPLEDEIRRLAQSSVNVCWYHTPPLWHSRASAPSMLLASGRPILVNDDPLVAHLAEAEDVYRVASTVQTSVDVLEQALLRIYDEWRHGPLIVPTRTAQALSWTVAAERLRQVWETA